jgi:hypothetical protein
MVIIILSITLEIVLLSTIGLLEAILEDVYLFHLKHLQSGFASTKLDKTVRISGSTLTLCAHPRISFSFLPVRR